MALALCYCIRSGSTLCLLALYLGGLRSVFSFVFSLLNPPVVLCGKFRAASSSSKVSYMTLKVLFAPESEYWLDLVAF